MHIWSSRQAIQISPPKEDAESSRLSLGQSGAEFDVVDFYYALQGGRHPGSAYVQFAAANMTGANRLLVGLGWPTIVLLYWWRSGKRSVELRWDNAVEISFLALGSLYSFIIVLKQRIEWFDALALFLIFGAYLWRLSRLPKEPRDDDDEPKVGPGAAPTSCRAVSSSPSSQCSPLWLEQSSCLKRDRSPSP